MIPYLLHSRKPNIRARPSNRFSPEMLEWLFDELHRKMPVTSRTKGAIIETLREMTELMIWGDQHNPAIFDLFCEKQMLAFFMEILEDSHNDSEVGTQLLQTLYMIMENVRSETTLFYLLSSNRVNQLIRHEFDFRSEELLAFYISLLKSIALRVNNDTIQFFFNESSEDFPLYTSAIAFFNHKDSMVRIAVRTIALSLIRIDNERIRAFIVSSHGRHYFANLAESLQSRSSSLRDLLDKSTSMLVVPNSKPSSEQLKLGNQLEQIITVLGDEIYYVHDLLTCGVNSVEVLVFSNLIESWLFQILPMLLADEPASPVPSVSQITTMYTLAQVLHIFNYSALISAISIPLVHPAPSDYTARYPPAFAFTSFDRAGSAASGNVYRQAVFDFMGCGDRFLLLGLAVLYALTKNAAVSRVLLEEAGLKPLRYTKSKQLLNVLTADEEDVDDDDDHNNNNDDDDDDERMDGQRRAKRIIRNRATTLIRQRMAISPTATMTTDHPLSLGAAAASLFDADIDDDPFSPDFHQQRSLSSSQSSDASSSSSSSSSASSASSAATAAAAYSDDEPQQSEPDQQTVLVDMLLATLEARQAYRMTTLHLTTQLLVEMLYVANLTTVHSSKSRRRIQAIFAEACRGLLSQRDRLAGEEFLTLLYEELREWRHPAFDVILSSGAMIMLGHPDSHARRVIAHTSAPAARAVRMFQEFFLLLEFHLVFFADVQRPNIRDIITKNPAPLAALPPDVLDVLTSLGKFTPATLKLPRSSSSPVVAVATPTRPPAEQTPAAPEPAAPLATLSSSSSVSALTSALAAAAAAAPKPSLSSASASSVLSTSPIVATVTYADSPKPKPVDPVELQVFRDQFPTPPKTPPAFFADRAGKALDR